MAQHDAQLVTLAPDLAHCPPSPLPEIAFSGRSNVGKSSLLNLLVGRTKLAYVSKTPGRTRTLTYYLVDQRWHLVDMPGYGYAQVPPEERRRWLGAVRAYLREREQLRAVVQLIDMRVGFTLDDRARVRELLQRGLPLCIAMTKSDKVPRARQEGLVRQHLGGVELPPQTAVVLTSALHGYGRKELWGWVRHVLAERAAADGDATEPAGAEGDVPNASQEARSARSSGPVSQDSDRAAAPSGRPPEARPPGRPGGRPRPEGRPGGRGGRRPRPGGRTRRGSR